MWVAGSRSRPFQALAYRIHAIASTRSHSTPISTKCSCTIRVLICRRIRYVTAAQTALHLVRVATNTPIDYSKAKNSAAFPCCREIRPRAMVIVPLVIRYLDGVSRQKLNRTHRTRPCRGIYEARKLAAVAIPIIAASNLRQNRAAWLKRSPHKMIPPERILSI